MQRRTCVLLAVPALAFGVALGPAAAALAATTAATAATAATTGATAAAKGANEAGKAGDPASSASAILTFDTAAHQLCYTVTATSLKAVAMHIHKGAVGVNGPVVVPLDPSRIGAGKTCTSVAAALLSDISANPASYYFNAHTKAFPAGAVRGQLVASASTTTGSSSPTAVSAGNGGQAQDSTNTVPVVLVLVGAAAVGTAGWRLARR